MKSYTFRGYCVLTGEKITKVITATTTKHARRLAYRYLTYPTLVH